MKLTKHIAIFTIALATGVLGAVAQELVSQENHDNGQVKSTIHANGDQYLITEYYEDGTIKEKGEYLGTIRHGKFISHFENGKMQMVANYENGIPAGEWVIYNESGQVIGNAIFNNGKCVSGSIWNGAGKLIADR